MDFDEFEASVGLLLRQMEDQPEDRHELHLQLREKINEMRAYGMPAPDDSKQLLKTLEAEFARPGSAG